jgi:hypothetical protein
LVPAMKKIYTVGTVPNGDRKIKKEVKPILLTQKYMIASIPVLV